MRTEENIAAVSASVNDDYQLSIRRRFVASNFIIKMRALLRKFIVRFSRLIDPLKRLFGLLWLNFTLNLHGWTLKHLHAYVKCKPKKISQLYRPVLIMTINYRFVVVRSNWASVTEQRGKFYGRIDVWSLLKYSWCKNWGRPTYGNAEFLVNGLLEYWPKIHFFQRRGWAYVKWCKWKTNTLWRTLKINQFIWKLLFRDFWGHWDYRSSFRFQKNSKWR